MSCTRRPPHGRSSGSARPGGDREPGPVSARALSTAVGLAVLVGAAGAAAHPLGNFSINHYAALEIAPPVVYVRDIIAVVRPGVTVVRSPGPSRGRSGGLASYPTDLLGSPPQDLEAQIVVLPAASAVAGFPSSEREPPIFGGGAGARRPTRDRFTELVGTPDASLGVVAIALLVASALGAFHALEPGHGKTVVAAYLVGSRGTARHALILGLIVTASHTAGVYLLGGITFYASRHIVPERLYPLLRLASRLTIAVLGVGLFRRRYSDGVEGHAPP